MLSKRRYKKEKNIPTLELRQLKLIQVKLITGTRYHRELCSWNKCHFMIGQIMTQNDCDSFSAGSVCYMQSK